MTLFLFGLFFVLLLLELPVAFAIGVSSSVAVLLSERLPPTFIVSKIFAGLDSFPLMAIPFYILAGNLMTEGGLTQKIVELRQRARRPRPRGPGPRLDRVGRHLLRRVRVGGGRHGGHRVDHDPGHEDGSGTPPTSPSASSPPHAPWARSSRRASCSSSTARWSRCRSASCSWPASCPALLMALMLMVFAAVIVRRRGYAPSHARFVVRRAVESPGRRRLGAARPGDHHRRHRRRLVHADGGRRHRGRLRAAGVDAGPPHRADRQTCRGSSSSRR